MTFTKKQTPGDYTGKLLLGGKGTASGSFMLRLERLAGLRLLRVRHLNLERVEDARHLLVDDRLEDPLPHGADRPCHADVGLPAHRRRIAVRREWNSVCMFTIAPTPGPWR